jgi:hypothetical protein
MTTPSSGRRRKRGRPPKFGRAAELVALTLPRDVLAWLRTIHRDPAWAIVSLFDRSARRRPRLPSARPATELVSAGRGRSLIVVDGGAITALPGVSLIPLSAGRSFLALSAGQGLADLELAVLDRLEQGSPGEVERRGLTELRGVLRAWRRDRRLVFRTRSIIVVEHRETRRRSTSGRDVRG